MTDLADISRLVDGYRSWLKDRTVLKSINTDWVEISTPFLDRHNDYIQIYAKRENDGYLITDDGHTIRDLEMSGCTLDTPRRQSLLRLALNGFAVDGKDGRLSVRASGENFAARKHALVQAMLAVNDLSSTASSTVRSLFKEDVAQWLDLAEIRYIPDVQFVGKSGFVHYFDFAIPRSRREPERIVKAINNPNKDAAQSFIFAWLDTREERPSDSVALAFLNDSDRAISPPVVEALGQYDIKPIVWSSREKQRLMLAA